MARFEIQNASSIVNWTGKKVLGLHTGTIKVESGYLELADGLVTGGEIKIDMTSIVVTDIEDSKTHDEFLGHLQNDDFFSVDKFKTARLEVTGSTPADNNNLTVNGHLTIKNITHPITFNARIEVFTNCLHSMGEIIVDRALYNIRYGSGKFFTNLGNTLIYDEFILQFKLVGQTR